MNKYITLALLVVFSSCGEKKKNERQESKMFKLLSSAETGIDFINEVIETDEMNIETYEYIYNGNGVSVGDIDRDGLLDVFFSSNQGDCKLYRNLGEFQFEDITEQAGISTSNFCTGTVMADVNNDGFMDIYVCKDNPFFSDEERENYMFMNNGDGTFTESAEKMGINNNGFSSMASFFDMDNDGDLDLFVGNHPINFEDDIRKFSVHEINEARSTDRLFKNNGDETFTDVTEEAGVGSHSFALSIASTDFNRDGYTDLYVCNDYFGPDFCYINQGDGTFVESHKEYFKHTSTNAMGSDAADFNNDGLVDLTVLDMLPQDNYHRKLLTGPSNFDFYIIRLQEGYGHQNMKNTLQLNTGEKEFNEIACYSGTIATDWSWAPLFADYDNDGWKDLYVTNGYYRDVTNMDFVNYQANFLKKNNRNMTINELAEQLPNKRTANYAYKNEGNLKFSDVSRDWGLDEKTVSNGAAYADLNNDGKLDLIACNMNQQVSIYKNFGAGDNFIQLELEGSESNRMGLGSKATVFQGESIQYAELYTVRGYNSSVSPYLHFGLGSSDLIDSIRIDWPSGKTSVLLKPEINQKLIVKETDAIIRNGEYIENSNFLFSDVSAEVLGEITHVETGYVDFKREPLLPHMFSKRGPGLEVGDLNGDGLEDFFLSGTAKYPCQMYLQQKAGNFSLKQGPWLNLSQTEVVDVAFFDADNDGDLDLYLASGSNEFQNPNDPLYQDILYLNDGAANFLASDLLPKLNINTACVEVADIDGDNDLDLFIGGNVIAGQYPKHHPSYFLMNENGKFTINQAGWAKDLMNLGLVNKARFADINGDNKLDLLIAGEWMSIKALLNTGSGFENQSATLGLDGYVGWWNSVEAIDYDQDGDLDLFAGNIGLNAQYMATDDKPIVVDFGDLDGNGSFDAMVSQYYGDVLAPIYSKAEINAQMRYFMNTHYKFFEDYAVTNTSEILKKLPGTATRLSANHLESTLFENIDGKYVARSLPADAQFSPIYDFHYHSSTASVLAIGNSYDNKVELGWVDGLNGLYLELSDDGKLSHRRATGFYVPEVAKGIKPIMINGVQHYLVSVNHGELKLFKVL